MGRGYDREPEYLMHLYAIDTGGTFTVLTDDSGGGNRHMEKKTMTRARKAGFWLTLVTLVVGWMVLFFLYRPEQIVAALGVTNSYIVTFLLGVLGAFTSMTTFSTYPAVYAMAAADVTPWALIATTAVGLTMGDFFFVLLGNSARAALSKKWRERVRKLLRWLEGRPDRVTQWVLFIWVGVLPLANNLLTAPLAVNGFEPRKMAVPIFLGNLTFPTATVILALKGVEVFNGGG